jgi:hypothetical protein
VQKYVRVVQATDGNIIRHMCFARGVNQAADAHSEKAIFIAFPRRERASLLRYTYMTFLV